MNITLLKIEYKEYVYACRINCFTLILQLLK